MIYTFFSYLYVSFEFLLLLKAKAHFSTIPTKLCIIIIKCFLLLFIFFLLLLKPKTCFSVTTTKLGISIIKLFSFTLFISLFLLVFINFKDQGALFDNNHEATNSKNRSMFILPLSHLIIIIIIGSWKSLLTISTVPKNVIIYKLKVSLYYFPIYVFLLQLLYM